MSYGWDERGVLSACAAEFLVVNPYFNSATPIQEGQPPVVELTSPNRYPAGSESVTVKLKATDPEGIHQVILFATAGRDNVGTGSSGLKRCRGIGGETDVVVEFEYDGDIPFEPGSSLSYPAVHRIVILAVDTDGDVSETEFFLSEIPQQAIAFLEGHKERVEEVSFSPDGTMLASGAGYGDEPIRLWVVETGQPIGTLEGHERGVFSLSFSPDGNLLASVSSDNTVRLWDVASRRQIVELGRHSDLVAAVSFSPDGKFLVSGSFDGTVRMWDVANRVPLAILEHEGWVYSLSFSRDGKTLASASTAGKVWLWDVASRATLATLQGHAANLVYSVSFSPDGTTLASGAPDNTVILWDVTEWTVPRPSGLKIISGERQRGEPGATLADSLIVEVRDQNGNPLTGAAVTFTVVAGGGSLSFETATTDAEGRASTTLTLGRTLGTNTVVATAEDLDPVTFTAIGRAHADFDGDGTVGFPDFLQFAARFGLSQGNEAYDARFDLDGNGTIGFSDFLIFAGAFGKSTV